MLFMMMEMAISLAMLMLMMMMLIMLLMRKMFVIDDVNDNNDYNDNIVDNFEDDVNVYHCLDGLDDNDNVSVIFICWCCFKIMMM